MTISNFFKKNKTVLMLLIPMISIYVLFNYLPIKTWINSEWKYLTLKLCLYLSMSIFSIIYKKKKDIELDRPFCQINYLYLIPLLIPCFANLIYMLIREEGVDGKFEYIMIYDLVVDAFGSIIEDLLFVDFMIYFLLNNLKCKNQNAIAVVISGIIFMAAHCYSFLDFSPQVAVLRLVFVALLTMECGYLAIFFDSFLIPVIFHFLFNAINYIIFDFFYYVEVSEIYYAFNFLIAIMASNYVIVLWHLSELQHFREKHKHKVIEEKKDEIEK